MITLLDRVGTPFSPEWVAEFRGFFAGEGSLSIQVIRKKDNLLFRPRCRISLRLDDREILEVFHIRIGGSLFYTDKQASVNSFGRRNPTITWDASSLCHAKIIRELLRSPILPAKKFKEFPLWSEAIDILLDKKASYKWGGLRFTPDQKARLLEISALLKELKVCKVLLPKSD